MFLYLKSLKPQADAALLNTTPAHTNNVADDGAKVNVVSNDFKSNPATVTSEADVIVDYSDDDGDDVDDSPLDKKKRSGKKRLQRAEQKGLSLWNTSKQYLFRPGVAGGLVGIGRASTCFTSILVLNRSLTSQCWPTRWIRPRLLHSTPSAPQY